MKNIAIAMASAGLTQGIAGSETFQGILPQGTDIGSRLEQAALQQGTNAVVNTAADVALGKSLGSSLESRLLSAAANAVGSVSANEIGAAYADGTLDPISHEVAHALLGCAVGAANGSCTSGAVSGALSEAVAGVMGDALSENGTLSDQSKSEILAAGQIAGILGASAFDGNVQAASAAAYNAVLNNYLTTSELADRDKKLADCKGDENCIGETNALYSQMDSARDVYYVLARGACAVGSCDDLTKLQAQAADSYNQDALKSYIQKQNPDWTPDQVDTQAAAYTAEFKQQYETVLARPAVTFLAMLVAGRLGGATAAEEAAATSEAAATAEAAAGRAATVTAEAELAAARATAAALDAAKSAQAAAEGVGAGTATTNTIIIDSKIGGQLGARGWTQQEVQAVVSEGPVGTTMDNRSAAKTPDGLPRSDPASVYGSKNGYVVVNDRTREVVQVSGKNDPGWIPDSRIMWK